MLLLQAGYPGDKQFKLMERKGQMLFELGKYDEAKDCFLKAKKLVKNSTLNEAKTEKFVADMDKYTKTIEKKKTCDSDKSCKVPTTSEEDRKHSIVEITDPHPKYKSLDASVDIKYTPEQGRFAVANRDIAAGEAAPSP